MERKGNVREWKKGDFAVTWHFDKQHYAITKSGKHFRFVYSWREAKPYLD